MNNLNLFLIWINKTILFNFFNEAGWWINYLSVTWFFLSVNWYVVKKQTILDFQNLNIFLFLSIGLLFKDVNNNISITSRLLSLLTSNVSEFPFHNIWIMIWFEKDQKGLRQNTMQIINNYLVKQKHASSKYIILL